MVEREAVPVALFDLDNTLLDRAQAFAAWAQSFFAQRGIGDRADVAQLVAADRDGRASRHDLFADLIARYELSESVADLVGHYRDEIIGFLQVRPEVRSGLTALRDAGWRIGIVTNGSSAQERKIHRSGLADLVDGWAISGLEGVRKPDIGLFACALDRVRGRGPGGALWVIGDHPTADIGGGRQFGASTIWIHRGRPWPATGAQPTHIVGETAEAIELLLGTAPD